MGFLDKAKKMAEQAQSKLDDVQKQFNEGQRPDAGPSRPVVEYDEHGRPIQSSAPPPAPPAGPATPGVPDTAPPAPPAAPAVPEAASPPRAPATPPGAGGPEEDPNRPSYEAPKLSSGDPLEG